MSIFSNILNKIFHHDQAANQVDKNPATPIASPNANVDVSAVLSQLAAKNGQALNWKNSIVDLLKLLNLDSSLAARKELAKELHYSGDTNDTAAMNIWLQKQVMQKLSENGGKVPDELRA